MSECREFGTYRVASRMDNEYEVWELDAAEVGEDVYEDVSVFQGSLADCESYIRLQESGYMR